jgi:hypothetical protein
MDGDASLAANAARRLNHISKERMRVRHFGARNASQ